MINGKLKIRVTKHVLVLNILTIFLLYFQFGTSLSCSFLLNMTAKFKQHNFLLKEIIKAERLVQFFFIIISKNVLYFVRYANYKGTSELSHLSEHEVLV